MMHNEGGASWISDALGRNITRRQMLELTGAGIASVAVLAACGLIPSSNTNGNAGTSSEDIDFIKGVFGGGTKATGKGLSLSVAAGLLLSGDSAPYGQTSLRGIQMAVKQIQAAGGPTLNFDVKDTTASATAAADAIRGWASAGIPFLLTSGAFGGGADIKPSQDNHILTFDPGGGLQLFWQGLPYIWAGRALTPIAAFPGLLMYMQQKMPQAKRIAVAGYDLGPLGAAWLGELKNQLNSSLPNVQVIGTVFGEANSSGVYDWTPVAAKLRPLNADIVFFWAYGTDPASFMKAYATQGLSAPVVGPDWFPSTASLAGSAISGYMFAYDYFNWAKPENEWGMRFAKAYKAQYGEDPTYYPANYYQTTFFMWELVKRVLANGGDPKNGSDLQTALQSNPSMPSVYGSGSKTGTIEWDTSTHQLVKRPMGLFEIDNLGNASNPRQLASFDIGGKDFAALGDYKKP